MSWIFPAVHLHATSGELVCNARRAEESRDAPGNLTHGPYLALARGRYGFEISYCSIGSGVEAVGRWDIMTVDGATTTLDSGDLPDTVGHIRKVHGEFLVPEHLSRRRFEVRTFFNGVGRLDIYFVRVFPLDVPHTEAVRFGDLRRLLPLSDHFGGDRGEPLDRFYISEFLAKQQADIKGRVMEVGDRLYTLRFGGHRVRGTDVLSPTAGDSRASLIADLTDAPQIASCSFDCVILTQVLNVIYDARAVVDTVHRILKPGGVVLATIPSIQKTPEDYEWPFMWGFTHASVKHLFIDAFGEGSIKTALYGNVLAATAFLYGLSYHELRSEELSYLDPNFPVIIGVRAVKAECSRPTVNGK